MRTQLVSLVLAHARRRGVDVEGIAGPYDLADEHRDPSRWSLESEPMPVATISAILDSVAEALDDPVLGVTVADSLPKGVYGVVEYAARNAATLRDSAALLVRYQRLINDAVRYALEEDGGTVSIVHTVPGAPDGVGVHGNLFTVALLRRFCAELGGQDVLPRSVELAHADPRESSRIEASFAPAEVRIGTGRNSVSYPAELFDRRVPSADPALLAVLDRHAALTMPPEPATTWVGRLRELLARSLSAGAPSIEEAARGLRTSPRNLQRRLADEETSYSAVLEALRAEQGRRLVADPAVPLSEVAFLLGYSQTRALVRAFRRWTGESPQAYRQRLRAR